MTAATTTRRTQAERREATTGRLLDATIACLAELGYTSTSVSAICSRAGCSQGALFRHYATRRDLIAAAADEIGRRHVEHFGDAARSLDTADFHAVVRLVRDICRTDVHAAWREIIVAARTDAELRELAHAGLDRFEALLLEASVSFLGIRDAEAAAHAGMVLLSVMHMFDSEAMTVDIHTNDALEQRRVAWAAEMLARELGPRGR